MVLWLVLSIRSRVRYGLGLPPNTEEGWFVKRMCEFLNDLVGIWYILLQCSLIEFHEMICFRCERKGTHLVPLVFAQSVLLWLCSPQKVEVQAQEGQGLRPALFGHW